jgi:hypothetical protein
LLDPRGVEQGPDFEFVASLRLLFLLAGFEPLMVSLATWLLRDPPRRRAGGACGRRRRNARQRPRRYSVNAKQQCPDLIFVNPHDGSSEEQDRGEKVEL